MTEEKGGEKGVFMENMPENSNNSSAHHYRELQKKKAFEGEKKEVPRLKVSGC